MTLKAESVGEIALKKLKQENSGRVHSVFSKAVNLVTDSGFLITVLREALHPCGINLSPAFFPFFEVEEKEEYIFNENYLNFAGGNVIDFTGSKKFFINYTPPNSGIDPYLLENNIEFLKKYLKIKKKDVPNKFNKEFKKRKNEFNIQMIRRKKNFREIIKSLAGFGPGLTPAGDDFLSGYLLTGYYHRKNLYEPLHINHSLIEDMCEYAKTVAFHSALNKDDFYNLNTSFFGRHQLYFSSRGYTLDRIWNLIHFLHQKDIGNYPEKMDKVLQIGATSGYAWMEGILTALNHLISENNIS
uniref:DUF2877 domain-containing protein n=1 Tax=uncultured organism TaxID=155900 RepID=M1P297_9ZZZZ|nr:hypothetical protein FLSS-28_0024 [uncultured organism]